MIRTSNVGATMSPFIGLTICTGSSSGVHSRQGSPVESPREVLPESLPEVPESLPEPELPESLPEEPPVDDPELPPPPAQASEGTDKSVDTSTQRSHGRIMGRRYHPPRRLAPMCAQIRVCECFPRGA